MRISGRDDLHLTYCLNIHPGETLDGMMGAISEHTVKVRKAVCPDDRFGVGLRMGQGIVSELVSGRLAELKAFLKDRSMYVFTVNGFPYGTFHGERVKENVYSPDWKDPARVEYTKNIIHILDELLDEGEAGSISTVPVSYREWITDERMLEKAVYNLAECAWTAWDLGKKKGKTVVIALEPEPDCWLDKADTVIEFFKKKLLPLGRAYLAVSKGLDAKTAETVLRRHIGVCLDTCHCAVQFENPSDVIRNFQKEGIKIFKIQLSAAVRAELSKESGLRLTEFMDPVYLHQTRLQIPGGPRLVFPDLSEDVVLDPVLYGSEVRTHFHVPLDFSSDGVIESTAFQLDTTFFDLLRGGASSHLEVETYTFDVLPPSLRNRTVSENIVAELKWVEDRLRG